jgi:transmembrane sensor
LKKYSNYRPEDFLTDERFRKWILSGGREESLFWEGFKEQFPEKINTLMLAKSLFMSLHRLQAPVDTNSKVKIWAQVQDSVSEVSIESESYTAAWMTYRWWMAAATLLLVGGLIWSIRPTFNEVPIEYEKQISRAETSLKEKVNTTKTQQKILLKDGTKVTLKPGSKLSYTDFLANQRIVYLKGEGFFEVAKDSSKPFLVYAGHIIVRVLGTSFNVVSNTEKTKSCVSVTSGKVKVYAAGKLNESGSHKKEWEVDIYPNQKVVFDAGTQAFEKSLVAEPVQLMEVGTANEFNYTDTSVNSILGDLETAYGVTIRRDNALFESCRVTAPLGDLPLFRKLDIVCQTIGATYEVFGTEIVISGGACNL